MTIEFHRLSAMPLTYVPYTETLDNRPPLMKQVENVSALISGHFAEEPPQPLLVTVLAPVGGGKTSFLRCLEDNLGSVDPSCLIRRLSAWDVPPGNNSDFDQEVLGVVCQAIAERCEEFKDEKKGSDQKELKKPADDMRSHAYELRIGRSEAAQAAVAFSDDPADYAKVFSENLFPAKSFRKFKECLQEFLDKAKTRFVLLIDDIEKRPALAAPLLGVCGSFQDLSAKLGIVISADSSRMEDDLRKFYVSGHQPLESVEKAEAGAQPIVPPALRMALLGEEIRVLPWTTSRQIAFLARKNAGARTSLEGRLIWSWFLAPWETDKDEKKKPTPEWLQKAHDRLVFQFIVNDARERLGELAIKVENAPDLYKTDLGIIGVDGDELIACVAAISQEEAVELIWSAVLIEDGINLKPNNWDTRRNDLCLLVDLLRNYLFPRTPRETVVVTNQLIGLQKQWTVASGPGTPLRPIDSLFRPGNLIDRWIRILPPISWARWQPLAFGRIMEEDAWGLYSGFRKGFLAAHETSILEYREKAGETPALQKRLENWTKQISREALGRPLVEREAMFEVVSRLEALYALKE